MGHQSPGNFQSLALASGEILPALLKDESISLRTGDDLLVNLRRLAGRHHLRLRNPRIPHGDVVGHGVLKKNNLLIHYAQGLRQCPRRICLPRLSIQKDLPLPGSIQPRDQLGQRRFPAPRRAHKGHTSPGLYVHGKIF